MAETPPQAQPRISGEKSRYVPILSRFLGGFRNLYNYGYIQR